MICAERGLKPQIELLLTYGVDVEKRDADGWTALMFAATEGAKAGCASLKLLLKKGANTEVKDTEFQMTAWLWAVDHGRCAGVQRARFWPSVGFSAVVDFFFCAAVFVFLLLLFSDLRRLRTLTIAHEPGLTLCSL